MTIGTTSTLTNTAIEIITDALTLLGIMGPDDSLSNNDFTVCMRFLNRLIKYWEASGAHTWTDAYATVWLQPNQRQYSLGFATTNDNWAEVYVETTSSASASLGATALTILTTTGMTVGDHIGIVVDTGSVFWTTIATIPTSTTLTLTVGLPSQASSGAYVYSYTIRPSRPLRILDISRRQGQGPATQELWMIGTSFYDYQLLTNKYMNNTPLQFTYAADDESGTLTLWPVPLDTTQRLSIHYQRPMFDFDVGTDTADITEEWLQCLVYTLATHIAPAYGRMDMVQTLGAQANAMFEMLDTYDQEDISIYMTPTNIRY